MCNGIVVGLLHVATDYQVLRLVACVPGAEGGGGGGGGGGRGRKEEDFCVFVVRYMYMT